MKKIKHILPVLLITLICLINCKTATNTVPKTYSVTDLCLIDNEISGWVKSVTTSCQVHDKDKLWSNEEGVGGIDGGAPKYIDKGLVEYIYLDMTNGAKSVSLYVMDFDSSAGAKAMYESVKDNDITDLLPITSYPDSVALIGVFAGGVVHELHANLNKFYFKLTFSGLADNTEAISTARLFLGAYKTKLSL